MSPSIMIYATMVLFAVLEVVTSHEREDILNAISENAKTTGATIFITISSLASYSKETGEGTERTIELNWSNVEQELVDDPKTWIGLFSKNPVEQGISSPLASTTISDSEGYFKTDINFPYLTFDVKNLTKTCLGFWIALIQNTEVLSSNCYSIRPNWMFEMRDIIGEKTLLELVLPGTHNAGAFMRYDHLRDNIKTKYQMCHDEDVQNQLIYGNRFLDLRPMYRVVGRNQEKFWISHGIFRTNTSIKYVLETVKNFLDSTKEIIIIDFHEFHLGLTSEDRHRELMELIIKEVGHYALPRSHGYSKTLNELWKMNKRLLIGYADKSSGESLMFYPGVRHLWANKDNLKDLKNYFDKTMCCQSRYFLWSAMAELTPSFWGVTIDSYGGLRKMAQDVNLNITKWFRNEWWRCANIISSDYFLGNDIINVAIEANKRKWLR